MLDPSRRKTRTRFSHSSAKLPESDRLFLKDNVTDRAVVERWATELNYEKVFPILAWKGNEVVGDATLHKNLSGWMKHVGTIRMVTAPGFQRKGLGSVLANGIFDALKSGLEKIVAEMMETGLEHQQAVQEKLAQLACYREGINAHLTAAIAMAKRSPAGLLMPDQSLLMTGRVLASSQLHQMMHIARELCGGQICVTPDAATFADPETAPWMEKYYTVNDDWQAGDRRKLLAFARDLLNSDYAGHRLTFQLFAQSPPYANLAAVYRNFDWDKSLRVVQKAAGLSGRVRAER